MEIITHVLTNPQQSLRDNTEDAVTRRSNARANIGAASQADLDALSTDLSRKIDKVSNANDGHLASLSGDGSLVDSGYSVSDMCPEVMLYKSSAPTMSGGSSIGLDVSGMTSTTWNDKGADGSVSVDSTGLVGLSVGTLYKCTARFDVHNGGASAAQVTLSASASFAEGVGETSSAVVATGDTTVEMNWYVKGASSVTFSATGLSDGVVTAGISSLFVREVCDI